MLPSELDFTDHFCGLVRFDVDGYLDSAYTPSTPRRVCRWKSGSTIPCFPVMFHFCTYPNPRRLDRRCYMLHLDAALDLASPLDFIGDETVDGPISTCLARSMISRL